MSMKKKALVTKNHGFSRAWILELGKVSASGRLDKNSAMFFYMFYTTYALCSRCGMGTKKLRVAAAGSATRPGAQAEDG
jgi:hypothetical protein